jgi:hypothetical protein
VREENAMLVASGEQKRCRCHDSSIGSASLHVWSAMRQGGETNKQLVLVYLHLRRAALTQAFESDRLWPTYL